MSHVFIGNFGDANAFVNSVAKEVDGLFDQLGPSVPVWLLPLEAVDTDVRAWVSWDEDGVKIGLRPADDFTSADLAHEVMHVLMDLEGYPTLVGEPDSGDFASALLDGEVDRRVRALGFDPTSDSDRDFIRSSGLLHEMAPEQILLHFITWNTTSTRRKAERASWCSRVERLYPGLALIGREVANVIGGGKMSTAALADAAFPRAAGILRVAGLAVGEVMHLRAEFESLRTDVWPRRLEQFLAMATTVPDQP
jgi:hypothetical protein